MYHEVNDPSEGRPRRGRRDRMVLHEEVLRFRQLCRGMCNVDRRECAVGCFEPKRKGLVKGGG